MTQSAEGPPAGWYDDPSGQHAKRYWDGTSWTEQVSSGEAGAAVSTPVPIDDSYFAPTPASAPAGALEEPTARPAVPPRLHILQKITPFQNVYRVFWDDNGSPGQLVAFVKQKRMALKEAFTVYSDEAATRAVLSIKADRRIDIRSAMTVTDPGTGEHVGTVRKKGAASVLRSTWQLEQPGLPTVTITERSLPIALLRRVWGLIPYANNIPVPWVFHFDAVGGGSPVFTHTRVWGWRDRYIMEIQDQRLDFRMAIAIGILMDAMQHR
ncbi:MAG TPA: DUF2510 domain-containing protein [Mycobacteriales bacterium]|nr:DUF2510 domain-containing protein [Mycobacteriales bacterium]